MGDGIVKIIDKDPRRNRVHKHKYKKKAIRVQVYFPLRNNCNDEHLYHVYMSPYAFIL